MNLASLTIRDVLTGVFFTGGGVNPATAAGLELVAAAAGAGVPVRLGSALTVRSLPWVSIIATGSSANLDSSAGGRRALAKA